MDGPGPKTSPTAVHAEGVEQETPLKKSPFRSVPGGVTADCTVQVFPSDRSASSPVSVFPTAVHADAEVHETAPRKYPGLCEVDDRWSVQVVPFHCSATVPSELLPELSKMAPTAVHATAEVHETPVRKLIGAPAGAGTGWTLQLAPFHLSAMTCPTLLFPTALQAFGDVHETAFKNAPGLLEVGVGWMLQLVPFQRSVSVPTELPELSKAAPTATQVKGDVHETPFSAPLGAPSGFGVGTIRHVVPSNVSARVPRGLPWGKSVSWPTAMQAEADLHDTPNRFAPRVPSGLAAGWMLHCVPSHPSLRLTSAPEASTPIPAAMHAESVGQATPPSWWRPGSFGVLCRLQLSPFQRSATVENVFELSTLQPTAVHAEEDEHATLFRTASCDPAGFGVDCNVQFDPFHRSASVIPELGLVDPTATQAEAEVHETEKSAAPGLWLVGVDRMLQLVPSQCSASEPWSDTPTAMQAVDETHATPARKLNCAPVGLGVDCTAQAAPVHRSTSVTGAPKLFV